MTSPQIPPPAGIPPVATEEVADASDIATSSAIEVAPVPPLNPDAIALPPSPFTPIASQNGALEATLQQHGFMIPATQILPRVVTDISGHEKTGKTRIALSSMAPIAYFAFDPSNVVGVVEEFVRDGKPIVVKDMRFPNQANIDVFQGIYQGFYSAVKALNATWKRGTIVIDTGAAMELLVRMNLFGQAKGVGTYTYEKRNVEMESLFAVLMEGRLNIIFLHNLKKIWISGTNAAGQRTNSWNGEWEPDRPDLIAQRVQMNAQTYRSSSEEGIPGPFHIRINNCRLASNLAGVDYEIPMGDKMTMPQIMSWIFQRPPEELV